MVLLTLWQVALERGLFLCGSKYATIELPMKITVLSWNVWFDNERLDDIISFINEQQADVVCLQEVSQALFERLKELESFFVVNAIDEYHGDEPAYLVIISMHPMAKTRKPVRAIKYRKSVRTLPAWIMRWREGQEYLYADVEFELDERGTYSDPVRFFNVHLDSAVGPWTRLQLFGQVLRHRMRKGRNIIAGDLNVLSTWYAYLYRVLLGSWKHFLVEEAKLFRRIFKRRKLKNIFEGMFTHRVVDSQFDYILVPEGMDVVSKKVVADTLGSDHKPILIEVEI